MRIDLYTKVVLTVIAIMLVAITFKPLITPETTASATTVIAQGAFFAGVQYSNGQFFDSRTGEIWSYGPMEWATTPECSV